MIPIDAISKLFDADNDIERKKLKDRDDIRSGKVTVIPHRHWPVFRHTNNSLECIVCHKMLEEVESKK